MPQQPQFVFYQFNNNRVLTGITHPLPKITSETEEIYSKANNTLKRKNKGNSSPSKRLKTNHQPQKTEENKENSLISRKDNSKLAPLLRVDKVQTMISVLKHEHILQDACHDDFRVLVDIEINEEVCEQLKTEEMKLNMEIARFLHFKQITDKKMPILSLEETKTLFARILESHLGQRFKLLDVTIKLKCCGAMYDLDKFSTEIPAKVIAKKVENVEVPLVPLPSKNEEGKFVYSKVGIQDQLKAKYEQK